MKTRNILFFCRREVNSIMGGVERVTETLARFLIGKGFHVVFMSVERTSSQYYCCVAPQYFVHEKDKEGQILKVIHDHCIEVVVSQTKLFCDYCSRSALPQNVKVVTVMHDSYFAMYQRLQLGCVRKWNWKRVVTKSLRKTYMQSDKIVVFVSDFIDEFKFFCTYALDEKFVVIPNANAFHSVTILPKRNRLLWVGRHAEWNKRTTDMLRIWSRLEPDFPEWSLDVLGDGPDGEAVRRAYAKMGLQRCRLCGVTDPRPYYEQAAIVCMTSSFESFGMVLTEGMQHGCVPVAYDSYTAVRYIVHDRKDGLLVTPFSTDEYACKLAWLMQHEQERERLSAAARESVKQYDAEVVFPMWIILFDSL